MPREHLQLGLRVEPNANAREYPVTCITAGMGNGLSYGAATLRESLPLWEGASVFVDHAGFADWGRAGGRSVRDLAGVLRDVSWSDAAQGIRGRIHLLRSADWLCRVIDECLALAEAGQPAPNLGLSADLEVERRQGEVLAIHRVHSLDVVMNPARGGEIGTEDRSGLSLATQDTTGGNDMSEQEMSIERVQTADGGGEPQANQGRRYTTDGVLREACAALLEARLAGSRLPDPFRQQLRARFRGQAFSPDDLETEVASAEQVHARLLQAGTVQHLGAIHHMTTPADRLQAAFDRLMGLPVADAQSDIPRLSGIRELYLLCTGDYDLQGGYHPDRAQLANMTTATLSSIVKNALNKALAAAYEMRPQWWKGLVWEEDFHTLNEVVFVNPKQVHLITENRATWAIPFVT